jgi:hypothetical protein
MSTALPSYLTDSLSRFLAGVSATRSINNDDSFSLVEFLAEAIFCAESNEFHGVPAVSAMLERLDECLDHHSTASEVRQAKGGELLQWFDAP